MIGQTFFHYKILEKLGEGGMGVVYKAEDTRLKRTVALKFLSPTLLTDSDARERFAQEAQAASVLDHPNICTVHDVGEAENGQTYIVMTYYGGETLDKRTERGPLALNDALDIVVQVALGLAKAHQHGIVHRDIKPANIIITEQGEVKILDFGLAKLSGISMLTKTGSTLGTIAYMSPEQVRGEKVDQRTDLWSLGIVLYKTLTGELPFRRDYDAAMAFAIMNEEPEGMRKLKKDLPENVELIVRRLLAKDPADRYASADDLLTDLLAVREGKGARVSAPPLRRRIAAPSRRRFLYISGALAAVLFGSFLVWKTVGPSGTRINPEMKLREVTLPFTQTGRACLSRDGNWVVFAAPDERNRWDVYFMNVSGGEARRVTTGSYSWIDGLDISPDGSQIAFVPFPTVRVWVTSTLGGTPRQLTSANGQMPKWHPDGKRIGFMRWGNTAAGGPGRDWWEYWTVNVADGKESLLFADTNFTQVEAYDFDWSPRGDAMVFSRHMQGLTTNELIVRNLGSGKERQITNDSSTIAGIAWLQNNQIVYVSNKSRIYDLWLVIPEGGESEKLARGLVNPGLVSASSDCRRMLLVTGSQKSKLRIGRIDRRDIADLKTGRENNIDNPCLSPDGKRIAYSAEDIDTEQKFRPWNLWVMDRDGEDRRQLTIGMYQVTNPFWSPDGKWLAYNGVALTPGDTGRFYVVSSTDQSAPRPLMVSKDKELWGWADSSTLIASSLDHFFARWSPDNSFLHIDREGRFQRSGLSADSIALFPIGVTGSYLAYDFKRPQEKRGLYVVSLRTTLAEIPRQHVGMAMTAQRKVQFPRERDLAGSLIWSSDFRWVVCTVNGKVWRQDVISGKAVEVPWALASAWSQVGPASNNGSEIPFVDRQATSNLILIDEPFK